MLDPIVLLRKVVFPEAGVVVQNRAAVRISFPVSPAGSLGEHNRRQCCWRWRCDFVECVWRNRTTFRMMVDTGISLVKEGAGVRL